MDTNVEELEEREELLDAISTSLNCLLVIVLAIPIGLAFVHTEYWIVSVASVVFGWVAFVTFTQKAFKFSRWRSKILKQIVDTKLAQAEQSVGAK